MASVNKVILIGRLGRDPELRQFRNGSSVCKFSLATDRYVQNGDRVTDWHRVAAFGKLGETIGQYFHKGSNIYIEGRMQPGDYEKDGVKQYYVEVIAEKFEFIDSKNSSQSSQGSQGPNSSSGYSTQKQAPAQKPTNDYKYNGPTEMEDDCPF